MIRIGIGYDIHRLKKGRKFLLGGIELPFEKGEEGHSDGDVLAHAVSDALLGASALGDIGEMFPPSDRKWKDADSMELLRSVYERVRQAGYILNNLDCVIICEKPKVLPFRDVIRKSLADALETSIENVFLKGKTAEGLGAAGKGKAVEVFAQCLLVKSEKQK
ncbi:MAG: 2-C-methyl-D-erythritol 2,4-cyclodiphosphate synthase [Treponema sp.]|nr:2-C-methyl-D-erythritol 2,4-cyclodiphosphate synthase [Treponema sp.]MCL2238234.1 2-C-methyl-D-erythritol 2,4-cyclodiphosphate synthase [Treponema sp.]